MAPSDARKTHVAYRVPYADTDQMGMVYYANFLVYFERARNEFLRECQFTYQAMEEMGLILPVIEAHCQYKQPARYDDLLELYAHFEKLSSTRITARSEVRREGELLANGYTVHACLDAKTHRPKKMPDALLECCIQSPTAIHSTNP